MNKFFKIVLGILGVLILLFTVNLVFFFYNAGDTKNLLVKGGVINQETKKPVVGAKIQIENWSYKKSGTGETDYSEYRGHKKFELISNEYGAFNLTLERSAFIEIFTSHPSFENDTIFIYPREHNEILIVLVPMH